MDSSSEMAVFVNVVREGGFSAAARALNRTPSAISKQITRLEDRLDVRLLNRTTRRFSMTDEGEAYYRRATAILADIAETEALVSNRGAAPRGLLRVTCSTTFGRQQIVPILPEFLTRYPDLKFQLSLDDTVVDLVQEGFDVAIGDLIYLLRVNARRCPVNHDVQPAKGMYYLFDHFRGNCRITNVSGKGL